jgi:hypothetical protein
MVDLVVAMSALSVPSSDLSRFAPTFRPWLVASFAARLAALLPGPLTCASFRRLDGGLIITDRAYTCLQYWSTSGRRVQVAGLGQLHELIAR